MGDESERKSVWDIGYDRYVTLKYIHDEGPLREVPSPRHIELACGAGLCQYDGRWFLTSTGQAALALYETTQALYKARTELARQAPVMAAVTDWAARIDEDDNHGPLLRVAQEYMKHEPNA